MNLTAELAGRTLRRPDPDVEDHLRMVTATNLAAGIGRLGARRRFVAGLPFSAERSPMEAATVAAIRLHARTQDDFYPHGRVHVGAITLAATLALADEATDRVLECLAAGYETMCLAAEFGSTHVQRQGLRPSGIFGPLGAAASAATALRLDEAGVANSIGLAAALAGGTNQAWLSGTDEWMFVVGQAARIGVEAALLTQAGVNASDEALEGRAGWMSCYLGSENPDGLRRALEDTASRIPLVAAKLYPVSGIAQLVAHLACDLHHHGSAGPTQILVRLAEPEVRYPGTTNAGPFRGQADALMSVPFVVACGLKHGAIRLEHLEHPAAADVTDILSRISVVADPHVEEAEAVLEVTGPGSPPAVRKIDGGILFPSWAEVSLDGDALARRSEAEASKVEVALAELRETRPDARVFRELLLEKL